MRELTVVALIACERIAEERTGQGGKILAGLFVL